ncbi:hypothetical protein V1264_011624 [Littorina saxatilis]|uniref:Uncharacterized protein n=3 Tax=Littorina saxatilis TaxID=31220 RepID=A0AAN9BZA7_9CAEN
MFLLVGTYATKLGKEYYHFSVCGLGKVLKPEHRYKELNAFTSLYCGMLCGSDRDCKSFDYDETKGRCYLGSKKVGRNDCEHLIDDTDGGVQHYAEGPQCIDGKEPQSDKTCRCPTAYGGPGCHTRMEDCSDWTDYFEDPVVMWIWPNNTERPFRVFCTKLSNVRTVLMNREVGDVDFQRDWQQYRDGFGNPTGDHWLGLHYMHLLTDNKRYKLR